MEKDKLEHCNCLTEYEKNILLKALNSAKFDAERLLLESERGNIITGKHPTIVKEELTSLIGDYNHLKQRVEKTPIC